MIQKIKRYLKLTFRNLLHNHNYVPDIEFTNCNFFGLDLDQVNHGVRCKTCYAFIPVYCYLTPEASEKLDEEIERQERQNEDN